MSGLLNRLRDRAPADWRDPLFYEAADEIDRLQSQLDTLRTDPAIVWANMLRGTIARPQALEHYEECKAEVERLTTRLNKILDCLASINVARKPSALNVEDAEYWFDRLNKAVKESLDNQRS